MTDTHPHALLSAWNKDGIEEFAADLVDQGFGLLASGGTAAHLSEHGLEVTELAEITGFAKLLGGRVKTLHPAVYAGILFRRDREDDREDLIGADAPVIDLVAVDLYPFTGEVSPDTPAREARELIDIGGVSLLRAAAKNYPDVLPVAHREDWAEIVRRLEGDRITSSYRESLAASTFRHTSAYDSAIAEWLEADEDIEKSGAESGLPGELTLDLRKQEELRYGENPQQRGARYRSGRFAATDFIQHQGKEMSYNNFLDATAALESVRGFGERVCISVVKHLSPCCIALGGDPMATWQRAIACDPMSAFGGIVAVNRTVDRELAATITDDFRDVLLAPEFTEPALEALADSKNLRVIEVEREYIDSARDPGELELRTTSFGQLLQTADVKSETTDSLECVTEREFPEDRLRDAALGERWIRHHRSNSIILVKNRAQVGYGVGQTSRVKAVDDAIELAGDEAEGAVLISDAFFPFEDALETAWEAGVDLVAAPGGSIRDEQILEWCDEHGVAVVRISRHFRH